MVLLLVLLNIQCSFFLTRDDNDGGGYTSHFSVCRSSSIGSTLPPKESMTTIKMTSKKDHPSLSKNNQTINDNNNNHKSNNDHQGRDHEVQKQQHFRQQESHPNHQQQLEHHHDFLLQELIDNNLTKSIKQQSKFFSQKHFLESLDNEDKLFLADTGGFGGIILNETYAYM